MQRAVRLLRLSSDVMALPDNQYDSHEADDDQVDVEEYQVNDGVPTNGVCRANLDGKVSPYGDPANVHAES